MATIDSLKLSLRRQAKATAPSDHHPLSDDEYSDAFHILLQGRGWSSYQNFVIPQLSQLLTPLFDCRVGASVLEIGPGPKTVLEYLPERLRRKIAEYTALEPNGLFATRLEASLCQASSQAALPLPCLKASPTIHRTPFLAGPEAAITTSTAAGVLDGAKFDLILFCHSMYGMKPKHAFLRRALDMLDDRPHGSQALVVAFHRAESLYLDGLVCQHTASFPTGVVSVPDHDEAVDRFAAFVAGSVAPDAGTRAERREICRAMGRSRGRTDMIPEAAEDQNHHQLLFGAPEVMVALNRHAATALYELAAEVPLLDEDGGWEGRIKNRQARLHRPAAVARPTSVGHVQACVRWALRRGLGLTILGGGHGGQCVMPNIVAVDMAAFDKVHVLPAGEEDSSGSGPLVVAGAGCKTGDIIRKALEAGLTVPLGARPSVGAGLWLQGGIGHLARLYGLACDALVGAVVVSVASGEVLTVGCVPRQHRPSGAVHLSEADDLLWALKGAGTNFGIVVSATFKAYAAPTYLVRNWVVHLNDQLEARRRLNDFDKVAGQLPRHCSADAYLYCEDRGLRLGVTLFDASTAEMSERTDPSVLASVVAVFGPPPASAQTLDAVGVFDAEMYMSGMHGGHGSGKTSSFKRCVFLKHIGEANIANILTTAVQTRPTTLCYLHLLHGGGAVGDVAADATAFGCRDWDYACVVTGVWPREQDGTETAQAAVDWVYKVAGELLPVSRGAYGADLGPEPRDTALAARAFGPNLARLASLKCGSWDPRNLLSCACPLPRAPKGPNLIVLVTGESGAGKDYCGDVWVTVLSGRGFDARAVSISEGTKREYAAATGADVDRLLHDRVYKERHRQSLTAFYQKQVHQRAQLPEEHFLRVVHDAGSLDVLFVTGMRDEAPLASFSHLVPETRLLEVYVQASSETRLVRGADGGNSERGSMPLNHRPSLVFDNDAAGGETVREFAERHLLPFLHEDLQRLAAMVRSIPDFPRPGIEFRHVLGIAQQPGGLGLCVALLERHFPGRWAAVNAVACCEAGGFIFASALAARVDVPLVLIREGGKLPPPTVSAVKAQSHISSSGHGERDPKARIEMDPDAVPKGAAVVVVDDVLATGRTLCAVLRLLSEAGVGPEDVTVMVVAEFPVHRGRELLRREGFGRVSVQSLLIIGGA
jgi:adenine phosphoribosyltransferase